MVGSKMARVVEDAMMMRRRGYKWQIMCDGVEALGDCRANCNTIEKRSSLHFMFTQPASK